MFEKFVQYLRSEKRYSEHTIIAYTTDYRQFATYIEREFPSTQVEETDYRMIRQWVVNLMENKNSNRSVNRKITTLKSYFKFLLREEAISVNPMTKVVSPKNNKRLPVFVEEKKMDEMLDFIVIGEGFEAIRNKMITETFYATGMRLSELINLKNSDIDFESCTLKVLGKRNKERIIPFSLTFKKSLEEYMKMSKSQKIDNQCDTLFFLKNGKKLYKMFVYRLINSYISGVSSITKKSPHVLRHTFATHMLNHGADINAIKEILGHANLSATQVYTHNTIDKLTQIYKQAHPRA